MTFEDLASKREAGRHEARLRELNQRTVDALDRVDGDVGEAVRLMCECSRDACEEMLELPRPVFERIRESTTRYVVVPGHVLHEIEDRVDDGDGWVVVRKRGEAARGAIEEASS